MRPLHITSLSKTYYSSTAGWAQLLDRRRGKAVHALRSVDLTIEKSCIFGLVGRNGQGKTTLIKCIAGLIAPTSGAIQVFGHDTQTDGIAARRCIGLVASDERSFYGRLTSEQNLAFFARLFGLGGTNARSRLNELVDLFEFRSMLDRRFQELSSGNKQRLALIRALLPNPPLLLLDEPTRSLDPLAAEDLRRLLKEWVGGAPGRTIFITSHNLQEVDNLCDRVGILSAGELKLVATMEELKERYMRSERIEVLVGGLPSANGLHALADEIPSFRIEPAEQNNLLLSFQNDSERPILHRVLSETIARGGQIRRIDTHRTGLLELLAEIEGLRQ